MADKHESSSADNNEDLLELLTRASRQVQPHKPKNAFEKWKATGTQRPQPPGAKPSAPAISERITRRVSSVLEKAVEEEMGGASEAFVQSGVDFWTRGQPQQDKNSLHIPEPLKETTRDIAHTLGSVVKSGTLFLWQQFFSHNPSSGRNKNDRSTSQATHASEPVNIKLLEDPDIVDAEVREIK